MTNNFLKVHVLIGKVPQNFIALALGAVGAVPFKFCLVPLDPMLTKTKKSLNSHNENFQKQIRKQMSRDIPNIWH